VPVRYLETVKGEEKLKVLKRLVVHECLRVYSDRLINADDKQAFVDQCINLKEIMQDKAAFISKEDVPDPNALFFCNFVKYDPEDPDYVEATHIENLKVTIESILKQYNKSRQQQKEKMNLLLFEYFLQHLSRVSRIISKPSGHGMLISLGSKGRRTATKVAAYCNGCAVWGIELRKNYGHLEWRDDLRTLFKQLGLDNKKTVF
jgi:dynein heavy chain